MASTGAPRGDRRTRLERTAFWLHNRWHDPALVAGSALVGTGSLLDGGWEVTLVLGGVGLTVAGGIRAFTQKPGYIDLLLEKRNAEKESADHVQINRDLLRLLLRSLAEKLEFGHTERVSLYVHDKAAFVMISRFSANPTLEAPGRSVYPEAQGIIGKAWQSGYAYEGNLPDPLRGDGSAYVDRNERMYGLPRNVVSKMVMKSRCLLGLRYPGTQMPDRPVGVVVFESTESNKFGPELQQTIEQIGQWDTLLAFLRTSRDTLPIMSRATERGF